MYFLIVNVIYIGLAVVIADTICGLRPTAWYDVNSFDGTTWSDKVGGYHLAFTGTKTDRTWDSDGFKWTFPMLSGGVTDTISFGPKISGDYTIFHVAKYDGDNQKRIFTSSTNNWFSGFNDGNIKVAYHKPEWITENTTSSTDSWLISTDTPYTYRAFGKDLTIKDFTATSFGAIGKISINTASKVASNFGIAEFILFNNIILENEQIVCIEEELSKRYNLPLESPITANTECKEYECNGLTIMANTICTGSYACYNAEISGSAVCKGYLASIACQSATIAGEAKCESYACWNAEISGSAVCKGLLACQSATIAGGARCESGGEPWACRYAEISGSAVCKGDAACEYATIAGGARCESGDGEYYACSYAEISGSAVSCKGYFACAFAEISGSAVCEGGYACQAARITGGARCESGDGESWACRYAAIGGDAWCEGDGACRYATILGNAWCGDSTNACSGAKIIGVCKGDGCSNAEYSSSSSTGSPVLILLFGLLGICFYITIWIISRCRKSKTAKPPKIEIFDATTTDFN